MRRLEISFCDRSGFIKNFHFRKKLRYPFFSEGFDEYWLIPGDAPTTEEANAKTLDELRVAPIFNHLPDELFQTNIVKSVQNEILARGIPELSYPIGYFNIPDDDRDKDMHLDFRRQDGKWPTRSISFDDEGTQPNRWLHTDLMNVAYFYTY